MSRFSDVDAETLALHTLDENDLFLVAYILRRLLKESREREQELSERVKRLEEARKQDREQEDYRPRRENW